MKHTHERMPVRGLIGSFLVITGLSALVVLWAVNSVQAIGHSTIATPLMGVLLAFVIIGLFFHVKSAH